MSDVSPGCRVCGNPCHPLHEGDLLGKKINYFECSACGYVQTEAPYWLGKAYSEAINACDTGIMVRNLLNARIVLATLLVLGKLDGRVVDYAGGYGILVRLLRDYGVDAYWIDRYCQNELARGFEYANDKADLVTAFEAFEHFENPSEELESMLNIAPNVLLSTELVATPAPAQKDWWYYGPDHGQHIGFFRVRTLQTLAKRYGKFLLTNGTSYHLFLEHPGRANMWKLGLKFNRLIPLLLRGRLISKTWPDHRLLSSRVR
ncbi:MAG: class I SAM-dependent methyltransferase [Steroidobacteraceae bacterium]